ncbi:MAG: 2-amino-4-hydroxy-6-hydroxymethyldihydropteridine diphosphokinase [Chloroflexi bacterium]|nr:2-amino-4-hydroxy-6-hydroxymethyldihydropteridine diphosphokinase [Chloroflexota bacterium]MBL01107.1 2-amino-4-hydroxy-6-hydroxymethyldihydropteridine diphosphokinase [Chloroflexota bacterium]|tara:strand:+ start:852 stop:1346 length:495 start_codon:yes stop_codon:yes gene_type:complete
MSYVFIGLGSNLGNRKENLRLAISKIENTFRIIKKSFIYETKPFQVNDFQPNYFNQVIKVHSGSYNPYEFLDKLMLFEKELGRIRVRTNESRIIDLDLLMYGDEIIESKKLTIPHPRIHERAFVVFPLLDIDEKLVHPVTRVSFMDISLELGDSGIKKVITGSS